MKKASELLPRAIREFGYYWVAKDHDQYLEIRLIHTDEVVGIFTTKEAWEWYLSGIERYKNGNTKKMEKI